MDTNRVGAYCVVMNTSLEWAVVQGQILIWLTFNYWTTWRSTTRWTRTYEGLRGALFFLLAAAWVDPGRNALQSAEQRC